MEKKPRLRSSWPDPTQNQEKQTESGFSILGYATISYSISISTRSRIISTTTPDKITTNKVSIIVLLGKST